MICPKCGCTEHIYFEAKAISLSRKPLPRWIAVLLFICSFIFFGIATKFGNETIYAVIPAICFMVCLVSGIIYCVVRKRRIEDDLCRPVMKRICKNCEYVQYVDVNA